MWKVILWSSVKKNWKKSFQKLEVLGFVKYHGMNAEQFVLVWFRSEILEPRRSACKPNNIYFELTKKALKKAEKEALKNDVKIP